jgi:hypothetical protein
VTHQFLASADDLNLIGDNTDTVKKNTETSIGPSKEVGLDISTEKNMYMLLCGHQNAGQNNNIKTANGSFENMAQFRYLGTVQSRTFCLLVCCRKT